MDQRNGGDIDVVFARNAFVDFLKTRFQFNIGTGDFRNNVQFFFAFFLVFNGKGGNAAWA